jgi:hypothetical protein
LGSANLVFDLFQSILSVFECFSTISSLSIKNNKKIHLNHMSSRVILPMCSLFSCSFPALNHQSFAQNLKLYAIVSKHVPLIKAWLILLVNYMHIRQTLSNLKRTSSIYYRSYTLRQYGSLTILLCFTCFYLRIVSYASWTSLAWVMHLDDALVPAIVIFMTERDHYWRLEWSPW